MVYKFSVRFALERHHVTLVVSYYHHSTQNLMLIKVYKLLYIYSIIQIFFEKNFENHFVCNPPLLNVRKNLIRINDIFKESSASSASVSASGGFGGASMGGSYEESQSSGFTYLIPSFDLDIRNQDLFFGLDLQKHILF